MKPRNKHTLTCTETTQLGNNKWKQPPNTHKNEEEKRKKKHFEVMTVTVLERTVKQKGETTIPSNNKSMDLPTTQENNFPNEAEQTDGFYAW